MNLMETFSILIFIFYGAEIQIIYGNTQKHSQDITINLATFG